MKQASGKEQPNQKVMWGVLGAFIVGCGVYLYLQLSPPTPKAAPAATVVISRPSDSAPAVVPGLGNAGSQPAAAHLVGTVGQLDPTLHMDAMLVTESLEYAGNGRNIFSAASAPVIPKAVAPARVAAVPVAPALPVQTGPPPPPPIDLKFFGTTNSADGKRQAYLLHGDDVYQANEGEIVGRRYRVIAIGAGSVVVEDMPNNNRQTLPLEAQ